MNVKGYPIVPAATTHSEIATDKSRVKFAFLNCQ